MNTEKSLIYSFTGITNSFRDILDKNFKQIGLHGGQAFVLISLLNDDAQTQISLARTLKLSAPTINKMIKSLAANDFVTCNKCENDGRSVRIRLTKKGSDIRDAVEEQLKNTEAVFFVNLTETEKLIFSQILDKLKQYDK